MVIIFYNVEREVKEEMIKRLLRKLFKIHSPSIYYEEKDTECDLCDRKEQCFLHLLDITRFEDTRSHAIKEPGYICPKKEEVAKAARELDPIVNEYPCKKCPDEFRMSCRGCFDYSEWISKLKGE